MVIGHRYPSKALLLVLHADGLVADELLSIILVDVGMSLMDDEGQEHMVVGDGYRINEIRKLIDDGMVVDELGSIEGVDVNPLFVLGQDQPLMVVGDGSPSTPIDFDLLEKLILLESVVIAEDTKRG